MGERALSEAEQTVKDVLEFRGYYVIETSPTSDGLVEAKVSCKRCGGHGWLPDPDFDPEEDDDIEDDYRECSSCGGQGWTWLERWPDGRSLEQVKRDDQNALKRWQMAAQSFKAERATP